MEPSKQRNRIPGRSRLTVLTGVAVPSGSSKRRPRRHRRRCGYWTPPWHGTAVADADWTRGSSCGARAIFGVSPVTGATTWGSGRNSEPAIATRRSNTASSQIYDTHSGDRSHRRSPIEAANHLISAPALPLLARPESHGTQLCHRGEAKPVDSPRWPSVRRLVTGETQTTDTVETSRCSSLGTVSSVPDLSVGSLSGG